MTDYFSINKANWEERASIHAASNDYGFARFVANPEHLSKVVQFDRPRLGDISGLRGVHLQCHIGTDTLSLARLGARMSGLDFSGVSLAAARRLAADTGTEIDYHESDVYDAVKVFGEESFELVYTGVGALCWLPSADRWAGSWPGLLKAGGRLFIREGHPMLWSLDERDDPALPRYPYFETAEPLEWVETGTYVDTDTTISNSTTHSWNHSLGEIITALLVHRARQCAVERDPGPDDARREDRRMAHDPRSAPAGDQPHHPDGQTLRQDTWALSAGRPPERHRW
jgi:SAM-dependent methyltransferase